VTGKGTWAIIDQLVEPKVVLKIAFGLKVLRMAFDGDSCLSPLHNEFRRCWTDFRSRSKVVW
jgi:hypothetical protein